MAKMMDENDSYLKKGMKDEPETAKNHSKSALKRAAFLRNVKAGKKPMMKGK